MRDQRSNLVSTICSLCENAWGYSRNGNIQVLLHMMTNIGLDLPDNLKELAAKQKVVNYTKDPLKQPSIAYKMEMDLLMPFLIGFYVEEAKAKDKLAVLKAFKSSPSQEISKELFRLIDLLYDTDNSNSPEYNRAFIQLKRNILLNNCQKKSI